MPRDDEPLPDAGDEDEVETDEGFIESDDDDPRPPELPPELSSDLPAENPRLSDEEVALAWGEFLATLPPRRRAILQLYEADPAKFGWLVGRDEQGRLHRLRLQTATTQDWDAAYTEHGRLVARDHKTGQMLSGPPDSSAPAPDPGLQDALWPDARAMAGSWTLDGPKFYLLLNVSLPNLHEARAWILAMFKRRHQEARCSALALAVAQVLCARPMAFWWLVFGPAVENWPRLFETLHRETMEVYAARTEHALRETWNLEGRPAALALLED